MFNIAFDQEAQKEFLKLDKVSQQLVRNKIIDLQNGNFLSDKAIKGNIRVSLEK